MKRIVVTPELLMRAMPDLVRRPNDARVWATALDTPCDVYEIRDRLRLAHFIANIANETGQLTVFSENLNYSAQGLADTWARFSATGERGGPPNDEAHAFARNPEHIANVVYADRMGNGGPGSGDGWRYRGRGLLQATGREMYRLAGHAIGIDLEGNPDHLLEPPISASVSAWIFAINKRCGPAADLDDAAAVRRKLNGGTIGLDAVRQHLAQCKAAIGNAGLPVARIQAALNAARAIQTPLKVDGLWGPITQAAADAFRREHGLPLADGPTVDLAAALRVTP